MLSSRLSLHLSRFFLMVPTLLLLCGYFAVPAVAGDRSALRVFDGTVVTVVTNEDPALAELLLADTRHKSHRVLTVGEWKGQKSATNGKRTTSTVFLVNRERLPAGERVPQNCPADHDELWMACSQFGRNRPDACDLTISAPDSAWLRRAIVAFRQLSGVPRQPLRYAVQSIVLVPVGAGAAEAATVLADADRTWADKGRAHIMVDTVAGGDNTSAGNMTGNERLALMHEIVLVNREGAQPLGDSLPTPPNGFAVPAGATVCWRERKPGDMVRWRVVVSAPNAAVLSEMARRLPVALSDVPMSPQVMATARDLRSVRRIVVAGVRGGAADKALMSQLASRAASEVRAMDAFEVLERAGLSEILGEVALGQAGIVQAADRAKVRRLAAADALLILEVTSITGKTDYSTKQERITPRMGRAPRRPLEPGHLRFALALPGKEDDPLIRGAAELLLRKVVGTKTDDEFRDAMNTYTNETLPLWQRQMDDYNEQYRTRPIQWRLTTTAHSQATVQGSLRLVDLTDGLVLWETPFTASDQANLPSGVHTVTTTGEDSQPEEVDANAENGTKEVVKGELAKRTAHAGLLQGLQMLQRTALLPSSLPVSPSDMALAVQGRVLDVDDTLLIGLGASDGVRVGDTLLVHLADKSTVRATVTRARPRTCDARLNRGDGTAGQRARVQIGQTVTREP